MSIRNVSQSILFKRSTRNAYVIKASKADYFIKVLNHIEMRDDGPIFRVMKEHIGIYVPTQVIENVLNKM